MQLRHHKSTPMEFFRENNVITIIQKMTFTATFTKYKFSKKEPLCMQG